MVSGIADSAAGAYIDQKELAKKNKEMAAKIKGTMSLLDNAKGIYTEFAPQIDAMKVQLADPSISNLDKAALSDSVTNSLNMFATQGTERVKNKLMEAQANYYNQKETGSQDQTGTSVIKPVEIDIGNGKVWKGSLPFNGKSNSYIDPETGQPINDINKWYMNKTSPRNFGSSVTPTSSNKSYKSTAFGLDTLDPTTKKDIANGRMAAVGGSQYIGSGGIPYAGLDSTLPTIATREYPAGTLLNVTSDMFPNGRNFLVAGTGPKSGILDFFSTNKNDYDRLANQKISNVRVVDPQADSIQGAASMQNPQQGTDMQNEMARRISDNSNLNIASNVSSGAVGTEPSMVDQPQDRPSVIGFAGGRVVSTPEQKAKEQAIGEIDANISYLKATNQKVPKELEDSISKAKISGDPNQLSAYSNTLKDMVKTAIATTGEIAKEAYKEEAKTVKEKEAVQNLQQQAEISRGVLFGTINEAQSIANSMSDENDLFSTGGRFAASFIPTSKQSRLGDLVDVVKNNIGVDTLQAMRKASPTGATGFGSLSAPELKLVKEKIAAISPLGKTTDIVNDLNKVKEYTLDIVHGTREQRYKMLIEGKINTKQFDDAEADYPEPKLLEPQSRSNLTLDQQARKKALESKYN
jgi:hypothetical protein